MGFAALDPSYELSLTPLVRTNIATFIVGGVRYPFMIGHCVKCVDHPLSQAFPREGRGSFLETQVYESA